MHHIVTAHEHTSVEAIGAKRLKVESQPSESAAPKNTSVEAIGAKRLKVESQPSASAAPKKASVEAIGAKRLKVESQPSASASQVFFLQVGATLCRSQNCPPPP